MVAALGRGRRKGSGGMRRIAAVFAVAFVAMTVIFASAERYADTSGLPRYCDDPGGAVDRVRDILSGETPPEGASRRPWIVAAKLMFLSPRDENEPVEAYVGRLRAGIDEACAARAGA